MGQSIIGQREMALVMRPGWFHARRALRLRPAGMPSSLPCPCRARQPEVTSQEVMSPEAASLGATTGSAGPGGLTRPRRVCAEPGRGRVARSGAQASIRPRSFFMAFFSICRIRSADTPYSSASSWRVDFSSPSHRRFTMDRLRSSRVSRAS